MKPHAITLIREPVTGMILHKSPNDILYAAYHTNRNFQMRGMSSINEFLAFLDIPYIEKAEFFGWDYDYCLVHCECVWLDIDVSNICKNGVYDICYWPEPKHYVQKLRGIRDSIDDYRREWDRNGVFFTGKPEEVAS